MQSLTIRAASPESARAIFEALSEFQVVLVVVDGHSDLTVTLRRGAREIVAVLHALARYAIRELARDGTKRISLEGRDYTLHPEPAPD
jgi:hypothetical protein